MRRELRHPYPFHRWRPTAEDVARMATTDRVVGRLRQKRARTERQWRVVVRVVIATLAVALSYGAAGDVLKLIRGCIA